MATRENIAMRRAVAIQSILGSAGNIGTALEIDTPDIREKARDPEMLQLVNLEAIAAYLSQIEGPVQHLAKINAEMEHDLAVTNGLWAFDSETGELVDPEHAFQIWHKSLGSPDGEYEVIEEDIPALEDLTDAQLMDVLDALTLSETDAGLMTKAQLQDALEALGVAYNARDNKDVLLALYQDALAGVPDGDPDPDTD